VPVCEKVVNGCRVLDVAVGDKERAIAIENELQRGYLIGRETSFASRGDQP